MAGLLAKRPVLLFAMFPFKVSNQAEELLHCYPSERIKTFSKGFGSRVGNMRKIMSF